MADERRRRKSPLAGSIFDRFDPEGSVLRRFGGDDRILSRRPAREEPTPIDGFMELGPVNFQIDAETPEEKRIAMGHIATARLLLGELIARSDTAPFLARGVVMQDGTEIKVSRNMNADTGDRIAAASIRVKKDRKARKAVARAGGPFIWIGLRDNRDKESEAYQRFKPFMAIWEPGTPDARAEADESYVGGQILLPFPDAEQEPDFLVRLLFTDGSMLVRAEAAASYVGTCENEGDEPAPSAVGFDPWTSVGVDVDPGEQRLPKVVTDAGLIGMLGGHDPTVDLFSEGWDDWEMSYILDPDPGDGAEVEVDPPDAEERAAAMSRLAWPRRYTGLDFMLSEEDLARFKARLRGGTYQLKLGVVGVNYRPGEWKDFESQAKGSTPGYMPSRYESFTTGAIPVTVKIVTGRGDFFQVREFDVDLSVPNTKPTHWTHRVAPGGFDDASFGMPFSGGCVHGSDDMSAQPYDAWFSGDGPVDFAEGETQTITNAHDTGEPPDVGDGLSQYETAVFVIDPKHGATRVEDPDTQPWGL